MNITGNTFSFVDLVRQYKIEIPIIQRDYAQGRDNPKAESIRKQFVTDLLNALRSEKPDPLELAFVYGRVENGVFIPLDGQQRLTTLYLLHMYLVKRCKMKREQCNSCMYENLLSRFTYATRQSAREFCEKISEPQTKLIPQDDNLIEYVHDQPWFFVEWQKDPTIEGMLRALEEIHLQMDESFITCCGTILAKLFGPDAPIRFRFMEMEKYGQTDDLYLKMNARGLPLTALENLKCSIESYCDSKDLEENREKLSSEYVKFEKPRVMSQDDYWEKMSFGKKLSRLFDGAWLDSFWDMNENNNPANCDAIMMVFVARLFALYAIEKDSFKSKGASDEDEYLRLVDDNLLGINGSEDYLPFNWFKIVLEHERNEPADRAGVLNRFANWMNIFSGLDKDGTACSLSPSWEEPIAWKTFLEKFRVEKAWRQYAALYAILSFFDHWETQWDEIEFKEWMRVQWNIIENGSIDSFEPMQRFVRACSRLANESKNQRVLEYLKSIQFQPKDTESFICQLKEEKLKAELILDKGQKEDVETAEKLPWFRGRISAIILDSDIDKGLKDWFSPQKVGDVASAARVEWVEKVICCIEQQYNEIKPKQIYFPVRIIINGDGALKEAIYNKDQGRWIMNARIMSDAAITASTWLNRMNDGDREGGWKNRICISSYRGGDVYAYRVANITHAYRLDDKIDWWYNFVNTVGAKVKSWQTNDRGTWIECEIEEGIYKGVYALYQDEARSFVQKQTAEGAWYPPSNEEARTLYINCDNDKSSNRWQLLLDELN